MIKPTISSFWIMLHFTRKDYLQTVKNGIKNQKVSRTDSQRSALSQGLLYDDSAYRIDCLFQMGHKNIM